MGTPNGSWDLQKLVDDHYASLYRYAFRLTGSAGNAEDLTQEAFCKAQEKFGQLRDLERARSWLFSILRNAYLHRVRSEKQLRLVSLDSLGDLPAPVTESLPPIDPEELQQALGELPEVFRTPVILFYFEEFSYRDIAEQMDLPLGTVMSRLARAKAFLRDRLLPPDPRGSTESPRRATDGL